VRCLNCQYSLENLAARRCPECSCEFDPNDPNTFDTGASSGQRSVTRVLGWVGGIYLANLMVLPLFMDAVYAVLIASFITIAALPFVLFQMLINLRRRP
jgi:hypothetical protein